MLPSTRRSRSSSSLHPRQQQQLVNLHSHIQSQNANETHQAIEDAMGSIPYTLQGKKKSASTVGIQLNNMLQNFYIKTVHIIIQSRRSTKSDRINKWFYLSMTDIASLRTELHFWNSKVYYPCEEPPPTLTIHIFLDTTHLSQKEVHKIMGDYMQQHNLHNSHDKNKIIIESWSLVCRQSTPTSGISSSDLPYFYKQSIIFFRALHSFARLLPGFSLRQRLQEQDKYSLCYRIETGMCSYLLDELPPVSPLFEGDHRLQSTVYKFSDILTPIGTLQLKVQYRTTSAMNDAPMAENTMSSHTYNANHHNVHSQLRSTLSRSQSSPTLHEQHGSLTATTATATKQALLYNRHFSSSTYSPNSCLKHIPTLCISPFKSPSLTPLPQKTQSSTASTSNSSFVPVVEKSKSSTTHCRSTSKKGEFSPSFNKYKNRNSTSRPNTTDKYLLNSMDGFNLLMDQDKGLAEFVRLVNAKPNLKLFQESKWPGSLDKSTTFGDRDPCRSKVSRTMDDNSGTPLWSPLGCSYLGPCETGSLERSKTTLDYFHTLRYAHSDLSESMASDLTITNSFPTTPLATKDDFINKEELVVEKNNSDQSNVKLLQRLQQQQRSNSSGTKSVMGTLVEEDDPLSS